MPIRPKAFCSKPRCPEKASRSGKCEDHFWKDQRRWDKNRTNKEARIVPSGWWAFREKFLLMHPRCECDQCLLQPKWNRPVATDVDHIDGCGRNGARAFDPTNLRAMSHSHHSERTAKDQPGGWNKRK